MTTSQSNEFLRNANGGERLKRWSGNYDSTREHLNFEIKKGGVICEVDKKTSVPKESRCCLRNERFGTRTGGGIRRFPYGGQYHLGGSRDQMHRLAFGDQVVNLKKGLITLILSGVRR